MFKYDVLCVGSATVDNFLTIEQPLSKVKLGDKVLVKAIEKHSGGGATNSAAALTKLGLKIKVLTKLGNDHDADFVLKDLKKYKIKNICLSRSRHNTDSATIVFSLKEKDRIIYVHKGASTDLSVKDFKPFQLNTDWIYLASLMGKSFQVAKFLASRKKKNTGLLFNPSLYLAKKGTNSLRTILNAADILVLNKEEAQALLQDSSEKISFLLKKLRKCGPKTVIITNGSKRMEAVTGKVGGNGEYEENIFSLIPPNVKIADTTGAGDAFTAGFLAGMIKNYSFEEALKLGQANSTSVIQHIGAKNKLLTEHEAEQLIKKYKIMVTKRKI